MMELYTDLLKALNITLSNEYIKVYQISFQLQNWFMLYQSMLKEF